VDEGLAAKARIHAHDEDVVDERKNLVESMDRSAWVYNHTGFAPVRGDEMERAIEMDASFLVNGDPIGAGFGKDGDKFVRTFDHEMTIECDFRDFAKRGQDGRPDCDVGDKVTIHHVYVENGRAPFDSGLSFRAEAREVS
jgi:hypothetical protein